MTDKNQGWTKELNVEVKYPFFEFFKKTVISRDDKVPYLIRTTLFRLGKLFSIKHHKILQSDDACLHDHPWPFISIILKGGYYEWRPLNHNIEAWERAGDPNIARGKDGTWLERRWYKPGSILYRPANFAHKLELPTTGYPHYTEPIPCHTLIFTGLKSRKWGFFTPSGWIYWRNYSRNENC